MTGDARRVVAILAFFAYVQVLFFPFAASAVDIDRDKLIYVIEDGLAASDFYADMIAMDSKIYRASSWLSEATDTNQSVGEAVMHARVVIDAARPELPKLRARLAEFPIDGPSFPPVFYWFSDWPKVQSAWLDQMKLRLDHLGAEADAVDAWDWDRIVAIRAQREEDIVVFQQFFDASDRKSFSVMPEDHPDRLLAGFYSSLDDAYTLSAERMTVFEESEIARLTLEIVQAYRRAETDTTRLIDQIESVLPKHRENVLPFTQVLAKDPSRAVQLADDLIGQYRETLQIQRRWLESLSMITKIEARSVQEGWTEELIQLHGSEALKMDKLRTEYAEGWRKRAALMAEGIAR